MEIRQKIFDTAVQDLKSVMILFNSGHYNLAVFQLQQAVEKFVKSFGLHSKIIKPEDLAKKISHLPHKVFIRQYSKEIEELSRRSGTPLLIPEMIPPHQRGKSNNKEKIEGLEKLKNKIHESARSGDIKNISANEIKQFIEQSKELEKEHVFDENKLFQDFKDDFIETNQHFKKYFKDFRDDFIINDIEDSLENPDSKVRNRILNYKHRLRQEEKFSYIFFVWVNLSLITSPHEQSSRYHQ